LLLQQAAAAADTPLRAQQAGQAAVVEQGLPVVREHQDKVIRGERVRLMVQAAAEAQMLRAAARRATPAAGGVRVQRLQLAALL
jgi:hypothetical protein